MNEDELSKARQKLVEQRLIAFRKPLYQVLALDHRREPVAASGEPCSIGQILRQMMGGGA
jgi:hypothetical protein